jgi:hypothetical protein
VDRKARADALKATWSGDSVAPPAGLEGRSGTAAKTSGTRNLTDHQKPRFYGRHRQPAGQGRS